MKYVFAVVNPLSELYSLKYEAIIIVIKSENLSPSSFNRNVYYGTHSKSRAGTLVEIVFPFAYTLTLVLVMGGGVDRLPMVFRE